MLIKFNSAVLFLTVEGLKSNCTEEHIKKKLDLSQLQVSKLMFLRSSIYNFKMLLNDASKTLALSNIYE